MERQGLKPDMGTDRRPRHSACTQAQCLRPATHVERRELWLGEREGARPRLARSVRIFYNTFDQNLSTGCI